MPISNMFHRHMSQNGTQHVHSFNKYKKHLLLSAENNSTLNWVIKLQIHLLSNHYLVDRQAIKVTTLLLPILHMSTTQLIGNNKQPTSKSTKYRRYHSAHQGSGRIQPNNQTLHPFEHHPTTNTLNKQTLNITNNNQTQTLHVTNMRPYTKHSKYKPRKPRTALVILDFNQNYVLLGKEW